MSVKDVQQKINDLELEIEEGKKSLKSMELQVQRLKFLAFEEEFKEEDNRRLLQE